MGEVVNYEDFKAKTKNVPIGPDAKMLSVRELVAAKRDAAIDLIFEEMDVVAFVEPIGAWIGGMDEKTGKSVTKMTPEMTKTILDGVRRVFGKGLTKLSVLVLDSEENRKRVGIDDSGVAPRETEYGYDQSEPMVRWVKNNVTPRQEILLLDAFLEVNDFPALVKNYLTLATGTVRTVEREESAQASP